MTRNAQITSLLPWVVSDFQWCHLVQRSHFERRAFPLYGNLTSQTKLGTHGLRNEFCTPSGWRRQLGRFCLNSKIWNSWIISWRTQDRIFLKVGTLQEILGSVGTRLADWSLYLVSTFSYISVFSYSDKLWSLWERASVKMQGIWKMQGISQKWGNVRKF